MRMIHILAFPWANWTLTRIKFQDRSMLLTNILCLSEISSTMVLGVVSKNFVEYFCSNTAWIVGLFCSFYYLTLFCEVGLTHSLACLNLFSVKNLKAVKSFILKCRISAFQTLFSGQGQRSVQAILVSSSQMKKESKFLTDLLLKNNCIAAISLVFNCCLLCSVCGLFCFQLGISNQSFCAVEQICIRKLIGIRSYWILYVFLV